MYRRLLGRVILLSMAVLWMIGSGTGAPDHPPLESPDKETVHSRISARVWTQIACAAPGERIPIQVTLRYDSPVSREDFISQHHAIFQDAGVKFDASYLMFSANLTGEQVELLSMMHEVYRISAPDEYSVPG